MPADSNEIGSDDKRTCIGFEMERMDLLEEIISPSYLCGITHVIVKEKSQHH